MLGFSLTCETSVTVTASCCADTLPSKVAANALHICGCGDNLTVTY